jgi:acyl-lipid omega-6 desaturase (Delta-12 desaturase)
MNEKKIWNDRLRPYTKKSNAMAIWQLLSTLFLYIGLWFAYSWSLSYSFWVFIPFAIVMAFFLLRFFVLMHDCGHGSLFESNRANKIVGYMLGVLTGMPQYVWSKHHNFHHITNGNWEKYKGPLNTQTKATFAKMNLREKRLYQAARHPLAFVTIGGFIYVLFNPRFNWFVGLCKLKFQIFKAFVTGHSDVAWQLIKECPSKKWKTPKEFLHMTYNNVALLSLWALMIWWLGALAFFSVYVMALSLSGGLGILFFTVQHNFEHSYAANTENHDYYKASLYGTSYLKLPRLLNWFTADIAYHHVHHLSTAIPNYQLKKCHNDLKEHFTMVKRIGFGDILPSVKYLLWDEKNERLISIEDFYKV